MAVLSLLNHKPSSLKQMRSHILYDSIGLETTARQRLLTLARPDAFLASGIAGGDQLLNNGILFVWLEKRKYQVCHEAQCIITPITSPACRAWNGRFQSDFCPAAWLAEALYQPS